MPCLINSVEPIIGKAYLYYKTTKDIRERFQKMYYDVENIAQCFLKQARVEHLYIFSINFTIKITWSL